MIIDIGQKVFKVELNFKKHDGDVIILEVPQERKTYTKQIPKPPKVTIINKGKKNYIEMEIGLQLNRTKDAKVYIASFSMFNNSTFDQLMSKLTNLMELEH
jgi:hypothetical protein